MVPDLSGQAQRPPPGAVRTVAGLSLIGIVASLTVLFVAVLVIRRNRAHLMVGPKRGSRKSRRIPDAWAESARRFKGPESSDGHETVDLDPNDLNPPPSPPTPPPYSPDDDKDNRQ